MKTEIEKVANILQGPAIETTTKTGVGFMGAFAAMSINEIAGFIVAVLTAIYMLFQIEAAWARRKDRNNK